MSVDKFLKILCIAPVLAIGACDEPRDECKMRLAPEGFYEFSVDCDQQDFTLIIKEAENRLKQLKENKTNE